MRQSHLHISQGNKIKDYDRSSHSNQKIMLGGYKIEAVMIAVVIIMLGQLLDQHTPDVSEQKPVDQIEIPRA